MTELSQVNSWQNGDSMMQCQSFPAYKQVPLPRSLITWWTSWSRDSKSPCIAQHNICCTDSAPPCKCRPDKRASKACHPCCATYKWVCEIVRLDCIFDRQNMQCGAEIWILQHAYMLTSVDTVLSFKIASAHEGTVAENTQLPLP